MKNKTIFLLIYKYLLESRAQWSFWYELLWQQAMRFFFSMFQCRCTTWILSTAFTQNLFIMLNLCSEKNDGNTELYKKNYNFNLAPSFQEVALNFECNGVKIPASQFRALAVSARFLQWSWLLPSSHIGSLCLHHNYVQKKTKKQDLLHHTHLNHVLPRSNLTYW